MSPDLDFLIFRKSELYQSCSKKARSQKSRVSKELKTFKSDSKSSKSFKSIQKVNVCSISFKIQRVFKNSTTN